MAPHRGESGDARERRFFLARRPTEGRAELLAGEAQHALRVLRMKSGDPLIGLDGQGGAWPLRVVAFESGRLDLATDGSPHLDPPPGSPDAALPWIEIALPWPKSGRIEALLDRLTQLGAAAISPLECERAGPHSGELSPARNARLERILREACKQCGRTWLPVLQREGWAAAEMQLPEASAEVLLVDPRAPRSLSEWIGERAARGECGWRRERPLTVLVGPEGGFSERERERFLARGANAVSLGPHTLRIETAAEAAMAILAAALFKLHRS